MMMERFQDTSEFYNAWHCLNCGEIIDSNIIGNRLNPPDYNPRKKPRRRRSKKF
jgi:hypothetical protein